MPANLQGIEITDIDSSVYNFEIFKRGDNQSSGVKIISKEWEVGDPIDYWKVPLFPFDGGLRQDRLPESADIGPEFNRARTYAKANIDASNEGVLVPPPFLNNIALTNSTTPTKQAAFDSKQFFLCDRYVYTVSRDGTLTLDKDFGSGKAAVDWAVFNNELIVAMGETEKIWKRAVGGTWTQATDNTFAIALGVVGNKLWRAESSNELSNCITTPLTVSNWTPADPSEYLVGDTTYPVHTIIDYGGVPYVLKADGVYAPDSKSEFHNQAPQMANWPHDDNGKGAFTAQGYLWVPSVIGLLRIAPGESLIRGPEKSNRPDFRFWVRAGIEWGEYIYLLVTDEIRAGESFVCKMIRDKYGITGGQEYIYHEWLRLGDSNKGYSLGINTWPNSGPVTVIRDAGTIANLAIASQTDWSNPTNAASSNDSYATTVYTGGEGTSDALRFSNFGFSLPTGAVPLGFTCYLERKTSAGTSAPSNDPGAYANRTGVGTLVWNTLNGSPSFVGFVDSIASGWSTSNYLKFTNFGFSIPANAVLQGITVSINRVATLTTGGIVQDNIVRLILNDAFVGNNKAVVNSWPTSSAAATYGSSSDLWGTSLTYGDINDADFGFAISVNIFGLSNRALINGASCTITVTYSVNGTVDSSVRIVDASATAVGDDKASATAWPSTDTLVSYGGSDDLWGTSLAEADIEDTDFGFYLIVENPSGITASVDYGYMAVTYQPSDVITNPTMFIGHGENIKYIYLGFGSGRDIDDPSYPFGLSMELETGLIQPVHDVTLVSGLVGVSMVAFIRSVDSITLQYGLGADSSYTNLLTTQEGSGTAAITGDDAYSQYTRYAEPNTTGPYFKFKLSGTLGSGSGTDRSEIRNMWAFGYIRPKVTDRIIVPIYCDRLAFHNGIPQGRTGGDTLRLFRAWKRDQTVFVLRFPDYEETRTIRARVYDIEGDEIISEKDSDGISREVLVAQVTFIRDDFANAYGNA